ncbi:MAG: PDZ domain-containing protein, partial [Clostridia bacterium]|nr:PDZ domain-containing protein [Clostridia bacterium]
MTLGVMALSSMVQALLSPFFWLVVLLVAVQHHRLARTRRRFLGIPAEPLWLSVFQATLMGIMGGCLGSGLLLVLGVSLT